MMEAHESTLSQAQPAPDAVAVSACSQRSDTTVSNDTASQSAVNDTAGALTDTVAVSQVAVAPSSTDAPVAPALTPSAVSLSSSESQDDQGLVYVLGSLNYDFGTEARRDAFKQLMAPAVFDGIAVPANPYDPRQMVHHLEQNPSEAQALIWTVDLELTPLYAIDASGPYAADVYALIRQLFAGQIASRDADEFVERVSIPGHLTGEKVRLFSGQVVPLVRLNSTRGLFGWRSNLLVRTAVEHVGHGQDDFDTEGVARALVGFLDKVYYEYRNLGVLSSDRALNFAATNAFQAAVAFADALAEGMSLDMIDVEPSPYARSDADAWDVKLKFFDPENLRRARRVYRFTVDVSETMPVTMGEVRSWSASL
jgi:cyanobactin maturation PatA/PatG family protease